MKIFVDIDETICVNQKDLDYVKAKPIKKNIDIINRLYDVGHEITYWSARGSATGLDWRKVTEDQFKKWGVKYHQMSLGEKPVFDLLIDDKAIDICNIEKVKELFETK